MNFSSLSYFEMLARERNFTRAAQRLHITQQSLSSNIAKMEQELGCQLSSRHVPRELTYAGEVLLRYASTFREEYRAMQQEFCDISQNQRGVLRIGVTYTRGRTILPDIIQSFQRQFPAIQIDLYQALLFGLICGLVSVVGDLCESRIKRSVGFKDEGNAVHCGKKDGKYVDLHKMAILSGEYYGRE